MISFAEATQVRREDSGSYAATIHSDFVIRSTGKAHGGYLLATLLRAVLEESPHKHPVATTAHFLKPGAEGPVEIRLQPHPAGRTVAATRACLAQNGTTLVDATITTATLSTSDTPQWSIPRPELPPIEECLPVDPNHPLGPGPDFLRHLDMRFDPGTMRWAATGQPEPTPELRTYFRLAGSDDTDDPDPLAIAMAVDSKPPATLTIGLMTLISTVELTLNIRAVPAPGWLALRATSRLISGGWADEDVDVWDSTGRLVAQSRQLMRLLRPSGTPDSP